MNSSIGRGPSNTVQSPMRKRIALLMAALAFALCMGVLCGCASTGENADDSSADSAVSSESTSADDPSSVSGSDADDGSQASFDNLVIIHTNDVHGYCEETDDSLGIAAAAQLKSDYIAQGNDVLLLDAGDVLQGNLFSNDSKGAVIPELMNAAGYDAMTLGNHEFDYGADVLQGRMDACEFPVVCANVTVDATGDLFAQPNVIITLSSGTRVGIFGLVTPETEEKSAPKNVAGISFSQGDDLYAVAQQQVDELRSQDCDLIICLGHLGEDGESKPNTAADVVQNTTGIDLFIDGHDHQVENAPITDKDGNDVLTVETGCYLSNIGVITYEDGAWTESLVAAGSYDVQEEYVADMTDAIAANIESRMSGLVATTPFALNGERYPGNRDRETNLGDLIADSMVWEASTTASSAPDAAILNGGGVRAGIEAGDITLGDVCSVLPFNDQLCTIEVTGAQLLEALESSTQDTPDEMGAFPQVSGITYTIDTTVPYERGEQYPDSTYYAPASPGARVTITDVNGKGFDLDATYVIVVSAFTASGGDAYYAFAEAGSQSQEYIGYLDYQALQYYLEDELGGTVPDSYAEPQGRITVIE